MGILRNLFGDTTSTNVLDLLTAQHTEMDELFEQLEKGEGDRRTVLTELADKLAAHATVEEKLFYPAIMSKDTNDKLQEAVQEHLQIKRMLNDLVTMKLDDESFKGKLQVLKEQNAHHAHKEEEDELFPIVRKAMTKDELAALGNEVLVMFEELMTTHPSQNLPRETTKAAPLPTPPAR